MKLFNYMIITVVMIISAQCVQAMEAHEENDNDYVNVSIDKAPEQQPSVAEIINTQQEQQKYQDNLASFNTNHPQASMKQLKRSGNKTTDAISSQKKSSSQDQDNESINSLDLAVARTQKTQFSTDSDAQQIATIKKIISANKITSPDVISIINNATTMDEINQQFTQLIMTTEDAQTSASIYSIASQLHDKFYSDKNISELYNLASIRNLSVSSVMNNSKYSLNTKIQQLQKWKSYDTNNTKFNNRNGIYGYSQNYKDNVTQLYDDAITKLQTQQDAVDQAQAQQNEQDKISAENAKNYTSPGATLPATPTPTQLLKLTIDDLQTQKTDAYTNFMKAPNSADLKTWISTTCTILWKNSAVSAKSIASTISGIFKQANVQDPNGRIADSMSNTAFNNSPKDPTNLQAIANWISSMTNMVSDAIFRKSATTNSPQSPNTLNTVPADATPTA